MSYITVKKQVVIHPKAEKELRLLPGGVQKKFAFYIRALAAKGYLENPRAKKVDRYLYEIRVRSQGQWRALYLYHKENDILILRFLHKQRQRLSKADIDTAYERVKDYR